MKKGILYFLLFVVIAILGSAVLCTVFFLQQKEQMAEAFYRTQTAEVGDIVPKQLPQVAYSLGRRF